MRERFVVLTLKRHNGEVEAFKELYCIEDTAIRFSMQLFRVCGLHKVVLIDAGLTVRFKDTRICMCTNIQQELLPTFDGEIMYKDKCTDCGVVIDDKAYLVHMADEYKFREMVK